jgi:hypothetical protein
LSENKIIDIHKAFLGFVQRAEKNKQDSLFDTFVSTSPLIDHLSSVNSQIIYGRRGTGKTHALKYMEELIKESNNERAIYIDFRSIGSNTSIYNDSNKSLSERASHLINDVLECLSSAFTEIACEIIDQVPHPDQITLRLDDFEKSIGRIKINGDAERTELVANQKTKESHNQASASLNNILDISASHEATARTAQTKESTTKLIGQSYLHIDFGALRSSLDGLVNVLNIDRLWLLLDEWSEVPISLQPYLADLIRRVILPSNKCVLKIAAIEHRSNFIIKRDMGEYLGFELSADITASLNLDEFLVFDTNKEKSINFFKDLLFKHFKAAHNTSSDIRTAQELINLTFTQYNVFEEFVRAVEGVPRDALNLAATLAKKCFGQKVTMADIRIAASDWFNTDKSSSIRGSEKLEKTLNIIVNEVIGNRKARAFLFSSNLRHPDIESLFDARLLHVLKKNISSKDEPGQRYDVFKIDYGCYVDLINTNKEPTTLFEINDTATTEVPADDYRSIRRAILRPEQLLHL